MLQRFDERLERNGEPVVAAAEEDGCTIVVRGPSELAGQPSLAGPRLPRDED